MSTGVTELMVPEDVSESLSISISISGSGSLLSFSTEYNVVLSSFSSFSLSSVSGAP